MEQVISECAAVQLRAHQSLEILSDLALAIQNQQGQEVSASGASWYEFEILHNLFVVKYKLTFFNLKLTQFAIINYVFHFP